MSSAMLLQSECLTALFGERAEAEAIARDALEARLASLLGDARTAWPELEIPPEAFLRHVVRHLAPGDTLSALAAVHAADLYLALACTRNDPNAMTAFDQSYGSELDRALHKIQTRAARAEDLRQILLQKLFVDDGGRGPKIALYSGRGSLRSWLRVTAVRTLIDLSRGVADQKREQTMDPKDIADLRGPTASPEVDFLKRRYEGDFVRAIETSLQSLSVRQRNLLRHQLIDGLTLEAIAALYKVHRVTVARWLAEAREQVARTTYEQLTARLGASEEELESLAFMLRSHLDLSVGRLLRSIAK